MHLDSIAPPPPRPRPIRHRAVRAARLALAAAGVALGGSLAAEPSGALATTPPLGTAAVVSGIVGYTRWPVEVATVRLCTLGGGAGVDELLRSTGLAAGPRSLSVRAVDGEARPWLGCDALYLGRMSVNDTRALLHALLGRPVLILGEGSGFCSDGGMFCLEPQPPHMRFQVNLDAIARSGLRVNPLVLRLARTGQRGGP